MSFSECMDLGSRFQGSCAFGAAFLLQLWSVFRVCWGSGCCPTEGEGVAVAVRRLRPAAWLRALRARASFPARPPGLFSALCADLAVRRDPGDPPMLSRWPRLPQASPLLPQKGPGQQRPCSRSVDGWVQRAVLPSQPPCPPGESRPRAPSGLLPTGAADAGLRATADLVPEIES